MPDLKDFYDHFKLLNQPLSDESESPNFDILPDVPTNKILNSKITKEEIKCCIQKLKNGKCPGPDMILNEYIKSTSHIFLPIYDKLFNAILDTGFSLSNGPLAVSIQFIKTKENEIMLKTTDLLQF